MARVIIGIHGLGNNPPQDYVCKWWQESIYEGFRAAGYRLPWFKFKLVFWTDVLHKELQDPEEKDITSPRYLEEPYVPGTVFKRAKPGWFRQKALDILEDRMDKIFLTKDMTMKFTSFTDKILQDFFEDLDAYYKAKDVSVNGSEVSSAQEAIRQRLLKELLKNRRHRILLIAHSMGTIVAYDVLSQGEHDIKVHTFLTMGSPLGLPVVRGRFASELKKNQQTFTALTTPAAVQEKWFNLSDLKDRVAINYNLADNYQANENKVQVEDIIIENNYSHQGKKNPHKSFGYLRAPETAEIIYDFITRDRSKLALWLDYQRYLLQKKLADRFAKKPPVVTVTPDPAPKTLPGKTVKNQKRNEFL